MSLVGRYLTNYSTSNSYKGYQANEYKSIRIWNVYIDHIEQRLHWRNAE
jgi:hypothetical protein